MFHILRKELGREEVLTQTWPDGHHSPFYGADLLPAEGAPPRAGFPRLGISSAEETEAQKSGRLWLPLLIPNQSAYLGAVLRGVRSLSRLTSLLGTVGTVPKAHNILGHTEMFNCFPKTEK